jgi:hypothetical protein
MSPKKIRRPTTPAFWRRSIAEQNAQVFVDIFSAQAR